MNWKIIVGAILMAPMVIVGMIATEYQYEHPDTTETRVEMDFMPYTGLAMIPFIGGAVLFVSGREDYENPEE